MRRLCAASRKLPLSIPSSNSLVISGWPAIERRYRALMPQPGEGDLSRGNIQTLFTTTAVAVESTLVRFNTMFAPDAAPKLIDEALASYRGSRSAGNPRDCRPYRWHDKGSAIGHGSSHRFQRSGSSRKGAYGKGASVFRQEIEINFLARCAGHPAGWPEGSFGHREHGRGEQSRLASPSRLSRQSRLEDAGTRHRRRETVNFAGVSPFIAPFDRHSPFHRRLEQVLRCSCDCLR